MNRSIRHWKQHKPGDRLVLLKRMLIEGVQYEGGDEAPPEFIQKLGKHRVRIWWQSRLIRNAEQADLDRWAAEKAETPETPPVGTEPVAETPETPPVGTEPVAETPKTPPVGTEPVAETPETPPAAPVRKKLGKKQ